jgi:phosphoribosylformimino-5-aminoimidazole carboxamide ribonucleotide (ProFAR) isomerase
LYIILVHDSYIENCNEKYKVILALSHKEPESFFDGWQLSVGIELVDDLAYLLLI